MGQDLAEVMEVDLEVNMEEVSEAEKDSEVGRKLEEATRKQM